MCKHVNKLQKEVDEAREKYEAAQLKVRQSSVENNVEFRTAYFTEQQTIRVTKHKGNQ